MKKILYIFLLTGMFVSCYEDKGNYDYTPTNKIDDITFTPSIIESVDGSLIEVQQPFNEEERVRRIEAHVSQTLAENYDKLHFFWNVSHTNEEGKYVTDTIETNGYLDLELPLGKSAEFNVLLQVYDTETTLSRYSKFIVRTRPIFKNSLFVLHGEEGDRKLGNIEVIGEETNVYTDAHGLIFPSENPHTDAEGLSYSTYLDLSNKSGSWIYKEVNTLTIFDSNSQATGYNPYGLDVKFYNQTIFKPENRMFVFDRNIQTGDQSNNSQYRIVLSKDGQFYIGNLVPTLYKPAQKIEEATNDSDKNPLHQSDYMITAATITENRFVLWDAKNNRFLYMSKYDNYARCEDDMNDPAYEQLSNPILDAHVDFSSLDKSPVGMKAVYAYIQYRQNYSEAKPYFIFQDEATNTFYRYELTSLDGDGKGGSGGESNSIYSIKGERLRNFNPSNNLATITYNSWFTTNYIFYADDNIVYRYNVSNGDKMAIYTAPEGYTISVIKFRTEDSCDFSGDLGRYLSIGMNKGDEGAIAEVYLNTAADVDKNVPTLFYDQDNEGVKFGKIKDLQFTQIYIYKPYDYSL